jgi:hypothetical protein
VLCPCTNRINITPKTRKKNSNKVSRYNNEIHEKKKKIMLDEDTAEEGKMGTNKRVKGKQKR